MPGPRATLLSGICSFLVLCGCEPQGPGALTIDDTADAEAIVDALSARYWDDRAIDEEELLEIKDVMVEQGPLGRAALQVLRSKLETNNGKFYPVDVQMRLWAFALVANEDLRASAQTIEHSRGGALTLDDANALLAAAGQDPTPTTKHAVLGLARSSQTTPEARARLQSWAESMTSLELLTQVVGDGVVTRAEWENAVWPEAALSLGSPSAFLEALIEVRFGGGVALEEDLAAEIDDFISGQGYPVSDPGEWTDSSEIAHAHIFAGDPLFNSLAQSLGRNDGLVHIGVVDGGFDVSHPALAPLLWRNPGEVANNEIDDDDNGFVDDVHGVAVMPGESLTGYNIAHGTHVLGVAVKGSDNLRAIVVVADTYAAGSGMDYAASHGARVVNLSMTIVGEVKVESALSAIDAHPDVLFVMSAGNDAATVGVEPHVPGNSLYAETRHNLIKVASADETGTRLADSNVGAPYVTVGARAKWRSTAAIDHRLSAPWDAGHYAYGGKTSQASPHVANLAARAMQLSPSLSPAKIREILLLSCQSDAAWQGVTECGGVVDGDRVLAAAAAYELVVVEGMTREAAIAELGLTPDLSAWTSEAVASLEDPTYQWPNTDAALADLAEAGEVRPW